MKVVFIHQDANITGSAISMLNLIKGFEGRVEVQIILPQKGPLIELFEEYGLPYTIIHFTCFWTTPGPKWYQKQSVEQIKALLPNLHIRNKILELKPDIVHLNDKACMNVGISLKGTGIPIVQHLRSTYFTTNTIFNKWLSAYSIKRYASQLISISEDELQGFERNSNAKVIFNTVDVFKSEVSILERQNTRKKLELLSEDFVVGYTANISKIKGAWDFLEMSINIVKRFPHRSFKFLIVGHAPIKPSKKTFLQRIGLREVPFDKFENYLQNLLLKDRIEVLGFQKDILDIIAAFDLMVIPTHLGALGRQPIEAMAVKTPTVITSGHSGKSRIVLHEENGLVVPMENVKALTDAVASLIESPVLLQKLAKQGHEYACYEFNPVINSDKVIELYQNLTDITISGIKTHGTEV